MIPPKTPYTESIMEDAGCTEVEAHDVEDVMRHDIFHSTLDWVPKARFAKAAKQAYAIVKELKKED